MGVLRHKPLEYELTLSLMSKIYKNPRRCGIFSAVPYCIMRWK